ncbi:MAG: succinate dehydrogenase assembly factor 2 [Paenirhodobacter sp.]|uniref:FAD assembly factor SdhE n=1 Tax=Paenirhodobacter sp. TaxID=1965326 RepID=UPI003D136E86
MSETDEARLKRMRMRSWRRGTKEMDLILGPWADEKLAGMTPEALDLYDLLLEENDQDLYPWVSGTQPCPTQYLELLTEIAAFAKARHGR